MSQALLVIDLQNDYFPGGKFPLWNSEGTLASVEQAMARARAKDIPIIIIQHIADSARGVAPFFVEGTPGAAVHPRVLAAALGAPVVVKAFADSFLQTSLEAELTRLGATELLLCGMMTQNCVTHTALSKSAEKYAVTILADACTTVNELLHHIALHALAPRVRLVPCAEAL